MARAKYSTILRKVKKCNSSQDCLLFEDLAHHSLDLPRINLERLLRHSEVSEVETTVSSLGYDITKFLKLSQRLLENDKAIHLIDADLLLTKEHLGLIKLLLNYRKIVYRRILIEKQDFKKLLNITEGLMGRPGHDSSVVEQVKELRNEGLSYSEISYRLEAMGLHVSRSSICRILKKVNNGE